MGISRDILKSLGNVPDDPFAPVERDQLGSAMNSIDNSTARLAELGYQPPKEKDNFLVSVLKNLSRTGSGANALIREFTNKDAGLTPGTFDPLRAFGRGFMLEENVSGKDIMEDFGLNGDQGMFGGGPKWYNPSVAGLTGLALDVLNPLDALNWLTFGTGKAALKAGTEGTEMLAKTFGSRADDIARMLGDDAVKGLRSSSAGRLINDVKDSYGGDALDNLIASMKKGIEETQVSPSMKFNTGERAGRISVGLQNPMKLGGNQDAFASAEIPGSELITGAFGAAKDKFLKSPVGDALAKKFLPKYVPTTLPDSVVIRDVTGSQLSNMANEVVKAPHMYGVSAQSIQKIKNELDTVQFTHSPDQPVTLSYLSHATGINPGAMEKLFSDRLPFEMDIPNIFNALKEEIPGVPDEELFRQAAKARKVMDGLYNNIPDELKPHFKGTVQMSKPFDIYDGSPLHNVDRFSLDSPMLNYVFNVRGVDVLVNINSKVGFNEGQWHKLSGIINVLSSLPDDSIRIIKDGIQLSPQPLGDFMGLPVDGYNNFDGSSIVLHDPDSYTVKHEYAHTVHKTSKVDETAYKSITDSGFISDYAKLAEQDIQGHGWYEDFADSTVRYWDEPEVFRAEHPERFALIDEAVKAGRIPPEMLQEIVSSQKARADKMANMAPFEEQIAQVMSKVGDYVSSSTVLGKKAGSVAYREMLDNLTELAERTSSRSEDLAREIEQMFKGISPEERRLITELAAGGNPGNTFSRKLTNTEDPVYYSKLKQVVEEKMPNRMNSSELTNMLKAAGVKDEEIEWLLVGLEGDKVTKESVLDAIEANNIKIEEVEANQYRNHTTVGGSNYKELLLKTDSMALNGQDSYYSGHWTGDDGYGEPVGANVIAHTRIQEIVENGKKVLHVQEIQSDWHQAGRKHGYYTRATMTEEEVSQLNKLQERLSNARKSLAEQNQNDPNSNYEFWDNEVMKLRNQLRELVDQFEFRNRQEAGERVPEAPFKTTWPELVVKRILRYAADNGFDSVAWSTGKQNADLYHLSNYVDKLELEPGYGVDGLHYLSGYKDSRQVINQSITTEELPGMVGDSVAKHLLEHKVAEGENLAVGGTGMRSFYDKIIPNLFSKYGKKHKVKPGQWTTESVDSSENLIDTGFILRYMDDGGYEDMEDLLFGMYQDYGPRLQAGTAKNEIIDLAKRFVLGLTGEGRRQISPSSLEALADGVYENMNLFYRQVREYADETIDEEDSLSYLANSLREEDEAFNVNEGDPLEMFAYLFSQGANGAPEWFTEGFKKSLIDSGELEYSNSSLLNGMHYMDIPDSLKAEAKNGYPLFKRSRKEASQLSDKGQKALEYFLQWRDSVAKGYRELQIPINEMESYVPFIPERRLKPDEKELMHGLFGTSTSNKTGSIFEEVDPNLKPRTTDAKSPREVNKYLKKNWLSEDSAVLMAIRGQRAIKAQELGKFLNDFLGTYGISPEDMLQMSSGTPPTGYKMYTVTTIDGGKRMLHEVVDAPTTARGEKKMFFLPQDMANLYNQYSDLVFGEPKPELLRLFDEATGLYKKVAYLWNPGHIPRDFIGNVFNGYLMGVVNPMEYVRTLNRLLDQTQTVVIDGQEMTVEALLRKAQDVGLLDVGAAMAETPRDIIDRFALEGEGVKSGLAHYSSAMREGTRKVDMLTRMTAMFHNLDKGMTFNQAATEVKKYMFDYFELTPFERKVMKRVMPFYTWMRKNIPLQVESLMRSPREYSRVESVMSASEGEPIDWDDRAEYVKDAGAFALGPTGDYIAPSLPYNDLNRVPTSLDSLLQTLSGVNPIIKAPVEIATNVQWFNGRPLEEYPDQTREMPFFHLLKALGAEGDPRIPTRTAGHLFDQVPVLRNLDIITNPENPKQISRASSFIGGPSVLKRETVEASKVYEQQRALNDFIKKLKDEGYNVPTTEEIKERNKNYREKLRRQ